MEINLERVVKLLKKNVILIIAISMVFAIASSLYSVFFITPQYSTGSRFKIGLTTELTAKVDTITYTARLLSLVNEVTGSFNSDTFYSMVSKKVSESGLGISPGGIAGMMSISPEGDDTTYFSITVTSTNASQAKIVSDAIAEVSGEYVSEYVDKNYALVLMKRGGTPGAPSSPNVSRNAIVGFFFGAAVSVAYIILADMMDRRVKSTADLVERFGYPILGIVPHFNLEENKEASDGKDGTKK